LPHKQLEAIIAADAAGDILPDIVQVRLAISIDPHSEA
jgi:hypothetical protein